MCFDSHQFPLQQLTSFSTFSVTLFLTFVLVFVSIYQTCNILYYFTYPQLLLVLNLQLNLFKAHYLFFN